MHRTRRAALIVGSIHVALLAIVPPGCGASHPADSRAGGGDSSAAPLAHADAGPRDLGNGLIVEDLTIGAGPECPAGAAVTMKFTASFASGHVYDSSAMRRQPLSFSLSSPGLIQGLKAGIPGMRTGGSRRIHIPWTLAYGPSGREPVPPKTDLIFDIELLEWKPADPEDHGRPAGAARPR